MEALMPIGHQGSMGGEGKTPAQPESQPQKCNFTALMPLWLFSLRALIAAREEPTRDFCV